MLNNTRLNQFSFYLFCLFPLLITLPLKASVAVVFVLLQLMVIFTKKANSKSKGLWFPILQVLPTAFFAISLCYSQDVHSGSKYLETSLMVLLIPWVFYANRSSITPKVQSNTLRFYVLVVSLFVAFILTQLVISGSFLSALKLPKSYYYIRTSLEDYSGMHPTYFSLLLGIAALILQSELKKGTVQFRVKALALICLTIVLAGLLLASSKMILVATLIGSGLIWIEQWSFKTILIRGLTAIILFSALVTAVKPMRQRAVELISAFTEEGINADNPDSMRKAIYNSTASVISENFWFGTGIGDAQTVLQKKHQEFGYTLAAEKRLNTHNNYLHIWLAAGIFPFLLFILLQLSQLVMAKANRNWLHFSIVFLFCSSMLTENILSRQDGVFLYAFFSSFLVFGSWSKNGDLIFINGRFKSQGTTGVQRFAQEISHHLLLNSKDFVLIVPTKLRRTEHLRSLALLQGSLWEQISLPLYLSLLGSPKLLNLCNSAPIYYRNKFITLHDVAFRENPDWFSPKFIRWYNYMIPRVIKRSSHTFTVSHFSKSELIKHFSLAPEKITVIYNGVPALHGNDETSHSLVNEEYVLCVGTLSERKNQSSLVDCFLHWENCPVKLVLAGSINNEVFSENSALQRKINKSKQIVLVENPSDKELTTLYKNAKFTAYLSSYEGFGVPVLESLAFNKPVLVSEIPVFRELFSEMALFVSLDNNGNIREKLEEMLDSIESWTQKVSDLDITEKGYAYNLSALKLEKVIKEFN